MRIGLIGCGTWGRYILRDLLSLGCAVHVVGRDLETRHRAEEGGATGVVGHVSAMPVVDGIVVATPASTHAEIVHQVLGRDVPVFVEKPMTTDAASARRLATEAPMRLFVMHKWRYHPGVELMGRIARSGELGEVVGLRTVRVGWGGRHSDVDGIWTLAPHDLSIAMEVLGTLPTPRAAVADFGDDGVAGLAALLGISPWHQLEVSTRSPERRRRITLYCRGGIVELEDAYAEQLLIYPYKDSGLPQKPEPLRRDISVEFPLLRELKAFVEHLAGGPPPRSSAAEGAEVVEVLSRLRLLADIDG